MLMLFYEYPKCSTCRNAKAYLKLLGHDVEAIDMVQEPPSVKTLAEIVAMSDYSLDQFFNSRGNKYRELGLKDKISELSDQEKLALLHSDGMLIKRPIAVADGRVVLGFNKSKYDDVFK